MTCALYKGVEKVDVLDRRDFNEDIIGNIEGAMNFLKQYIPVRYEMTDTPRRREVPEIPYGALREAVINAVAHRDYFEKGANVMVEIFDDRVEISNPGGLVKGLRPEDFGRKSILRNPNVAALLHRAGYIEKMGTGINKIRALIKDAGLPEPVFEFNGFFTVIFKRVKPEKAKLLLNPRQEKALEYIKEKGSITRQEYERLLNVSERTALRDLNDLVSREILIMRGKGPATVYTLK